MIGYKIKEIGSTAGVKSYARGATFVYISIRKERPVRSDKGINLADNLWSITTGEHLDTGSMVELAGRKYKVKHTVEGMSGIRKIMIEGQ